MARPAAFGVAGIGTVLAVAVLRSAAPAATSLTAKDTPIAVASHARPTSTPPTASTHLSGTDLLSAFFGRRVASIGADTLGVLIVSVPDPVSSHLDWSYDAELASVRRAFEHAGYVIDRFWLPWHAASDSVANRSGFADSLPGSDNPGVLLFRRRNPIEPDLRLVYLVGEVPTFGIHQRAFRAALEERQALLRVGSGATAPPIRIVGPSFSGSSLSLRRSIQLWRDSTRDSTEVEIVTGSASDEANFDILSGPRIHFGATVHTSNRLQAAAESLIVRQLGIAWSEVAFLHEGTTQYGQAGSAARESNANAPLTLSFPANISSLRVQYVRHPETRTAPSEGGGTLGATPTGPRIPLDAREPASLTESPAVLSQLTPPAVELLLTQLERTLDAHHIRAIGILATDIRDALFLADELRKRLHDAQLFFYGSNTLFLRPEYNRALLGSLVLSTYPLFLENQYWDLTKDDHERLVFMSDEAEGVFNATLYQLDRSDAMIEYVRPIDLRLGAIARRPPVWMTVIGRDELYPVTIGSDLNPGINASDSGRRGVRRDARYVLARTAGPIRSFTEPDRRTWEFLLSLFALGGAFVVSFALVQRRTAPRLAAVAAAQVHLEAGAVDAQISETDRAKLRRSAHWISLLLHRELYVALRYFAIFGAFAATLLVVLTPRSHGIATPGWSFIILGVLAALLTFIVARRAIFQSWSVLREGRAQGMGWMFVGAWSRWTDRARWGIEIVARTIILAVGVGYFVTVLVFLGQVLALDQRHSAFFFHRAVALAGGVSPAIPLILSGLGFATWCSWHLMRIGLLSEPTVYEQFLLRQSTSNSRLREARRYIRELQLDAEREARSAHILAGRAEVLGKRGGGPTAKAPRRNDGQTPHELLRRAEASCNAITAFATRADGVIAEARRAGADVAVSENPATPYPDTRDLHRIAAQARQEVERATQVCASLERDARAPAEQPAGRTSAGGNGDGGEGGNNSGAGGNGNGTEGAARTRSGRWDVRRLSDAVDATLARLPGAARSEALMRQYAELESWFEGVRRDARAERRLSTASQDVFDSLFYLVPTYAAMGLLVTLLAVSLWLASLFELSLESTILPRHWWLFGMSSFDVLFRFGVLATVGATAWAVYRLISVWSGMRTILADIDPSLHPAFAALPSKLACVTRLTPFGKASRAEIESVVEEKWKRLQEIEEKTPAMKFPTREDRPPCPRARPYAIDDEAYVEFERLHDMVEDARIKGYLKPGHERADETASAGAAGGGGGGGGTKRAKTSPQEAWAQAAAELYVVYVADYIDWIFQHLRYLATFLLVSLVLTVVLLSSYPFQPQSVLKVVYLIILVVAVATVLITIVQMNRDAVLSAITNTKAGVISWDGHFVGSLVTYGVIPLLTVVSTEFPEVRQFLFAWITPLLRAFASG